ncbi:hypothetical protein F2Q68_00044402 [Brassica cretica]|uniref:Plant thionin family protein n=2 Tax=Brassica cretica TaxID=69181 RepID=A0ABQ7AYT3_BRACR|nr:hypothetical protein F2Q68_00044402 [Brassica cretica]KAF3519163.1 hypothetical protein DY000_02060494 [Brassica cretica]
MTTQTFKKSCIIFMIVAIFTVMFSAQNSNVEKCVKHCIPNQCMKEAKKADMFICEEACKKFCNKHVTSHEEYAVPTTDGGFMCTHIWNCVS